MKLKKGDRVRLRCPKNNKEIKQIPFGQHKLKFAFMDEKTFYTINRIVKTYCITNPIRIYLDGVRNNGIEWSFSENWILLEEDVTEKVYNILKGIPSK